MPLVSPLTVQLVAAVVHTNPPGDEVAVYEMMAAPPLATGAFHETNDWALV